MTTSTRGRAWRRHQADRAYHRADRLIRVVLRHRADPSDEFAPSEEWVERMVRLYSVDRTHGRNYNRGLSPRDQRAAEDAALQS